ncbi:MAG TPA: hypothetical protein VFS92_05885 [Planctomycetota bacterium]|nr:hypothetical protein [Planctomycetota bacterium]
MPRAPKHRRTADAATVGGLCFLCRRPLAARDLERAYARVLTDEIPARPDFAHGECAQKAGYFDQPDAEEERAR